MINLTFWSLSSSRFFRLDKAKILSSHCLATGSKYGKSRSNTFHSSISMQLMKQPRRSADYHPTVWETQLIESFDTPYKNELYANRLVELKQESKKLLASTQEPCDRLKMIDSMQRLGVAYHFEEQIEEAISLLRQDVTVTITGDLNATALQFRLLREHGHPIGIDVFDKFRNKEGRFSDNSVEDTAGLLSLYEAAFLGYQEEGVLEEAKDFSIKCLNNSLGKLEKNVLAEQVQQSLEIPLHWRMPRVEARSFTNFYPTDDQHSSVLLELAKLDYNLVQSIYQQELKELSRWWSDLGFKQKLSFSRDRLIENYLWTMGIIFEPQFSKCRIGFTKFVCILSAIDDMYDIYASLDELELFTDAVKRWDIKAVEEFPDYMQICYFAMFNFANDIAYDILLHHGLNTLSYIKKEWDNLCTSYMVEARWFSREYTPSVDEYLENAWTSIGGPAAIVHAHLLQLQGGELKKSSLNCLRDGYELIYWSSLITRLSNDLGTSSAEIKRGDVAKSIQCYMIEKGISEEEARENIKGLIGYSWKMLNEKRNAKSNLPNSMVKMCLNMARTSQCIFQHGDGIGTSIGVTKDLLISLILKPIPIE